MATDKYPNQNVNMPMDPGALAAARARSAPKGVAPSYGNTPADGKGSRRQVGPKEWIDDRVHAPGLNALPSKDSPPELPETRGTPPATYDPTKVYQITLGKGAMHAGRMLSPGKSYQMVGAACTEVSAAIIDAVELGNVPAHPDVAPSAAKA